MEYINLYVSTSSHIILLVNVILCWIGGPSFKREFRFLRYYLLWGLLIQAAAKVLYVQSMNNLPLLHLYTLVEFILLSLFYGDMLQLDRKSKRNLQYFMLVISLLIILNSIFLQPLTRFNSNVKTLTQILYIGYAVYYFFRAQSSEEHAFPLIFNLFNSGILVYYAASLFIFMFSNVFLDLQGRHQFFWILNSGLYLVFQLLILYGLWKILFRKVTFT